MGSMVQSNSIAYSMQTAFGDVYKYNTQNSNIYAYLNILLEEINKKAENYETVCQKLLEVIMICMLRNNHLSIVQSSNELINRECTQIKNYLDANYVAEEKGQKKEKKNTFQNFPQRNYDYEALERQLLLR